MGRGDVAMRLSERLSMFHDGIAQATRRDQRKGL